MPVSGIWKGNDDCFYFARELGNEVLVYGEHPDGRFATVFWGRFTSDGISGRWLDVPKGARREAGGLELRFEGPDALVKAAGNFSASRLTRVDAAPSHGIRHGGFGRTGSAMLDGTWCSDDGLVSYIREQGSDVV